MFNKIINKILNIIFSVNPKGMLLANELHWILKDIKEAGEALQRISNGYVTFSINDFPM